MQGWGECQRSSQQGSLDCLLQCANHVTYMLTSVPTLIHHLPLSPGTKVKPSWDEHTDMKPWSIAGTLGSYIICRSWWLRSCFAFQLQIKQDSFIKIKCVQPFEVYSCRWCTHMWDKPSWLYDLSDTSLELVCHACWDMWPLFSLTDHWTGTSTKSAQHEQDVSNVRCSHFPSKQSQAVRTSEFTASVYTVQ